MAKWVGRDKVMSSEDAITRALSGARRKERSWLHELADLKKAHGAAGARELLGVSRSTWWAWNAGKRAPSKANRARITEQWNTPEVRKAAVPKRRANKAAAGGAQVKMTGMIGPRKPPAGQDHTAILDDTDRPRFRTIGHSAPIDLSPATVAGILDAFVWEGAQAAMEELEHAIAVEYFDLDASDLEAFACLEDLTDIEFLLGGSSAADGSYFDDFDE